MQRMQTNTFMVNYLENYIFIELLEYCTYADLGILVKIMGSKVKVTGTHFILKLFIISKTIKFLYKELFKNTEKIDMPNIL